MLSTRWTNVKPALVTRLVFRLLWFAATACSATPSIKTSYLWAIISGAAGHAAQESAGHVVNLPSNSRQSPVTDPRLGKCRSTVYGAGSALIQQWVNVSCLRWSRLKHTTTVLIPAQQTRFIDPMLAQCWMLVKHWASIVSMSRICCAHNHSTSCELWTPFIGIYAAPVASLASSDYAQIALIVVTLLGLSSRMAPSIPANTRLWSNVGLMLGQLRTQWANIKTLEQDAAHVCRDNHQMAH